jgi:hypothetical protein
VTIKDLRSDPDLADLPALRGNFRRRVYQVPEKHWNRLNELAAQKNPGYRELLKTVR